MKIIFLAAAMVVLSHSLAPAQAPDWGNVQQVLGRKGTTSGDMLKVTFPRSDLHVNVGTTRIEPGLALTSWVAFTPMSGSTMVMGDNPLIGEIPHVMYMHIGGSGEAGKLAESIKDVLSHTATPTGPPSLQSEPAALPGWPGVESIIGRKGARHPL